MQWVSMLVASVAPGISLLAYFYLKDRYMIEPLHLVVKVFTIGFLLVFPTMILQRGLYLWLSPSKWVMSFFLAAGVEEFVKWFILMYYIYNHKEFEEPYDGIVYAASVSLGFATMENIIYAWSYGLEPMALLLRALFPVSGHALFAVIMGYYLGTSKFVQSKARFWIAISLFIPILWHGIFDFILTHTHMPWTALLIPLMIFLWIYALNNVKRANYRSPYRTLKHDMNSPSSTL